MALFTDGPPSTVDDLVALDSQLLTVSNVEGIDLTQKLALAHEELGLELAAQLTRSNTYEQWLWVSRPPCLNSVVVSPGLRLWHSYRTLEMVYRDAYNSQLNDRYAGKRDQFQEMGNWAYQQLALIGLGVVPVPIPKAQPPVVAAAAAPNGGNLSDGTYYVTVTWVNAAGEEGSASDATPVTTVSGTFMVTADAAPKVASGWNVFAGTDPSAVTLQNLTPIQPGATWTQSNTVTTTGRMAGGGQRASYQRPLPQTIQRG